MGEAAAPEVSRSKCSDLIRGARENAHDESVAPDPDLGGQDFQVGAQLTSMTQPYPV